MRRLMIGCISLLGVISCKSRDMGSVALAEEQSADCNEVAATTALAETVRIDTNGGNHGVAHIIFLGQHEVKDDLDGDPSQFAQAHFVEIASDAGKHLWLIGTDVTSGTCIVKSKGIVSE